MKPFNFSHSRKWLLLALLMPAMSIAAELGTALKADTLRVEPFSDAKTKGTIAKNETVEIISKKGAWLQIKTQKNTGWVRIFSVKRGSASNTNQAKGVYDVASGRASTGKVISTTGIRGLSAEELKAAKFNEEEMKKLENFAVSAEDSQKFAKAGGLKTVQFAYLKGAK